MKRWIGAGIAISLCVLAGCSATEKSLEEEKTASTSPTPTSAVNPATPTPAPENDISSEVSELLADYYSSEEIDKVSTTSSTLEVKIVYTGSVESQPEDWDSVCENAISASSVLQENLGGDTYRNLVVQTVDKAGNIILTAANGKVRYTKFSTYDSSENPSTITLEEFNAIQTGMSYDEVFEIIGGRGEVLSETDLGLGDEYISIMFTWEGEGSIGANANVLFQGGKVSSKAQFGLE